MSKKSGFIYEYYAWTAMKQRCYNPKSSLYYKYGQRGIKVCDNWLNSFGNFLTDVGPKPEQEYSLERLNNNGDYEKGNCIWATAKDQARNRRSTKLILEDIEEIRRAYNTGAYSQYELAKMFDVCRQHIGEIVNNKQWKNHKYKGEDLFS